MTALNLLAGIWTLVALIAIATAIYDALRGGLTAHEERTDR